jgi:ABC-type lipoprotein release transport system permease subunit
MVAVTGLGVLLLVTHQTMAWTSQPSRWLETGFGAVGASTLHVGYILLVPGAVVLLGRPMARGVGYVLRVPGRLAESEFVKAPWRTTGACWVLMIGVSLITFIAVRVNAVFTAVWDFPARLPEVFVWSPEYVEGPVIERVRQLPGVQRVSLTTDVDCEITTPDVSRTAAESMVDRWLRTLSRPVFVAGEPEQLLSFVKVVLTEGNLDEAMAKMRRGGYVVIPPQTARAKNLHVGDRVTITIGDRSADFEIAGVVQSPALDMAVTAFQAETYMQFAAASAILGTRQDLKDKFGLDVVSMFMCDLELAPTAVPPAFPPAEDTDPGRHDLVADYVSQWGEALPEEQDAVEAIVLGMKAGELTAVDVPLRRFARAIQWLQWSPSLRRPPVEQQWSEFRERLLLVRISQEMDRPDAIMGSLGRLKAQVDAHLRRALVLVPFLPSILLAAASIGVANLMMISVYQRTRQIATLRAVGAKRSQIIRLVLGEAVTIGLLGSVAGLALGFHEAHTVNSLTSRLADITLEFIVPYGTIAAAVGLTVAICLLAAVAPARLAARDNVIAALQAT